MEFLPEKRLLVPAVVHVNGTGRVQTVGIDGPSLLRAILESFLKNTGIPILLNTSFNVAGEPIVESPEDALLCFLQTGLDAVVLGDILVEKPIGFSATSLVPKLRSTKMTIVVNTPSAKNSREHFDWNVDRHFRMKTVAIDQAHLLDETSGHLDELQARMYTTSRWGQIVSAVPTLVADILAECDGTKTLEELATTFCLKHPSRKPAYFVSAMFDIARVNGISLS